MSRRTVRRALSCRRQAAWHAAVSAVEALSWTAATMRSAVQRQPASKASQILVLGAGNTRKQGCAGKEGRNQGAAHSKWRRQGSEEKGSAGGMGQPGDGTGRKRGSRESTASKEQRKGWARFRSCVSHQSRRAQGKCGDIGHGWQRWSLGVTAVCRAAAELPPSAGGARCPSRIWRRQSR